MTQSALHHYYHAPQLGELRRLYWAHTVKELAANMATIFVPIYLHHLGYSLTSILAYFLLGAVFWGLIQAPALHLANRLGFNKAMAISLILQGLQILMLATIPTFHWPLWSIALVYGVSLSLYWPEFRACFTRSLLRRRVGPTVGVSTALVMLAIGVAPALGGAIATWFGIGVLYVITVVCFAAAALPLFIGPELIGHEDLSIKGLSWRKIWRDLVANLGQEVDGSISASAWPLFIFLITPTYVGVGVLSSVAVVASIVIALYVGRRRPKGMSPYLKHGAGVVSLTNAIRLLTQSVGQVAGVNFFNGLGQALIVTPYYSRYYENAENEPLFAYVYAMMIASAIGDILLFGSLLLLSLALPMKAVLVVGLVIGVPASYAMRLIRAPRTA